MNYRQPGPGTPLSAPAGPTSPQAGNMIGPGGAPRLDIGYSAPMPPPGGRRPPPRLDSVPDRKPMRPPVSGHSGTSSPNVVSPRPPGSPSFPPRMESRQQSHGSGASTPQPAPSVASPVAPSVASSTSSAPQQKPAKPPPSKGPKTFEEMGVPSANKDSDCVCKPYFLVIELEPKLTFADCDVIPRALFPFYPSMFGCLRSTPLCIFSPFYNLGGFKSFRRPGGEWSQQVSSLFPHDWICTHFISALSLLLFFFPGHITSWL